MCRTNRRYECEQPQQRRRGPTANIDKDIRGDRSGSTQAAGLITERDAGKQTHSSSAGEAAARLQEDDGGKQIKENRQLAELATAFQPAAGAKRRRFHLAFTAFLLFIAESCLRWTIKLAPFRSKIKDEFRLR